MSVCFVGVSASVSMAEYIHPANVVVKTEPHRIDSTIVVPGTYFYDVTWQGIPVATSKIIVDDGRSDPALRVSDGESYLHVTALANSVDAINWLYSLEHRSESLFTAETGRPSTFVTDQTQNSTAKKRLVSFEDGGKISAKYWKNGKLNDELSFESHNPTLDPLSAAFLAKSMPLVVGEKASFDVFNGKNRYLITFEVIAREKIEVEDREYDSFRVNPTVVKLTDTEGEKKLKSASIWVSADERRDILKLESKVWIGKVRATLTGFEPKRFPQVEYVRASLRTPPVETSAPEKSATGRKSHKPAQSN